MGTGIGTLMPTMPIWDTAGKLAGDAAIARVAGDAIPEFMSIHELHGFREILHPHTGENRSEDLFLINAHSRSDFVEERTADEKSLTATGCVEGSAVDHQLGPLPGRRSRCSL